MNRTASVARQIRQLVALPLVAVGLAVAGSACSSLQSDVRVFYIAPEVADCVGVGEQSRLLVREDPSAQWQFSYDDIQGFDHELGTAYVIEVEVETIPNPPADASSERYRLLRILEARQVAMDESARRYRN